MKANKRVQIFKKKQHINDLKEINCGNKLIKALTR